MRASDLAQLMTTSSADVLDSMYFTTVTETEIEAELPVFGDGPIGFTLRFAGDISGVFGLSVDVAAALTMAANFLGEEESDVSPAEVDEVVGELANMLCGSLVSGISSAQKFVLSHPEPLLAQTVVKSAARALGDTLVIKMDTDYGVVRVWVNVDHNECAL